MLKQYIEEREREFEKINKQCVGHYSVTLPPEVKSFHTQTIIGVLEKLGDWLKQEDWECFEQTFIKKDIISYIDEQLKEIKQ